MPARMMNFQNEQNMMMCYIRRADPQGWVRGRAHHQAALQAFLASPQNNNPIRIEVPHLDGGNFVANFRRVNEEFSEYIDENYKYVDSLLDTDIDNPIYDKIKAYNKKMYFNKNQ